MHDDKNAGKRLYFSGILFACFLAVLVLVEVGSGRLDFFLNLLISKMHASSLNGFFLFFTTIFDTYYFILLCLIVAALLFWKKRIKELAFFAVCVISGVLVGEIIKFLVQKVRPAFYFITETGFGFPSTHAVAVTLFVLLVLFLLRDNINSGALRKTFCIIGWALIILVSFSRLYFSVHWMSDVVGGILLGAGWYNFVLGIYQRYFS
jgi:undecaprenyl-diphosphatase